jgi:hypothetical protein
VEEISNSTLLDILNAFFAIKKNVKYKNINFLTSHYPQPTNVILNRQTIYLLLPILIKLV